MPPSPGDHLLKNIEQVQYYLFIEGVNIAGMASLDGGESTIRARKINFIQFRNII